jgi:hypothetical protein
VKIRVQAVLHANRIFGCAGHRFEKGGWRLPATARKVCHTRGEARADDVDNTERFDNPRNRHSKLG